MSNTPLERKNEILAGLHSHLRACTRRRRVARGLLTASGGMLAVAAAAWVALPAILGTPGRLELATDRPAVDDPVGREAAPIASTDGELPQPPRVTVIIAKSEPLPTTPCEVAPSATLCILSDEQLLTALAEAGRPSGLVRADGKAFIVPAGSTPMLR